MSKQSDLAEQWYSLVHELLATLQARTRAKITEGSLDEMTIPDSWQRGEAAISMRDMHEWAREIGCRLRIVVEPLPKSSEEAL